MGREQQANNDGFGCEVNRRAARRPESGERIVFTHMDIITCRLSVLVIGLFRRTLVVNFGFAWLSVIQILIP